MRPVGSEQQLEPCLFCGVQERAIVECVPAPGLRRVDRVPGERTGQSLRRAVVKDCIIQLMLGHASIQQTQRYLNVTDEEMRRGLEVSWKNQGRPLRLASGS